MTNSGMLICSFYLKTRFAKGKSGVIPLNQKRTLSFLDETIEMENVLDLFQEFCRKSENFTDDGQNKKMFSIDGESVKQYTISTAHAMSFVIKAGTYGQISNITDRRTQEVKYNRSEDEADIKRFLCVVYAPNDVAGVVVNKGIMVFQSIGSYGVKTITADAFQKFASDYGLTFTTRSVSIQAFMEKLMEKGTIKKIKMVRNKISPNNADNMFVSVGHEEVTYVKPVLQDKWIKRIISMFGEAGETGVCEVSDVDFDDIAIQFELGGKSRTIRLRYLERLSITEDIPDEIIEKNDESLVIEYMITTAESYKDKMILTIGGKK